MLRGVNTWLTGVFTLAFTLAYIPLRYRNVAKYTFSCERRSAVYDIEVYSTVGCKYCRIAKQKLKEIGVIYEDIDISSFNASLKATKSLAP
jgi:hypothetical protein